MATQKTPVKKPARKTTVVKRAQSTSRRPANSGPTFHRHFDSIEEELQYIYGSMTLEDSLRILYKAGILTPSGRLSSKYK
ncbi:hypothetical protein [Stenotrophomonas sp. PS02289]|uniref:hypothetical protein n=1 Tax=Stenotrophomonas sp. PS02289 TaxID=2991422 RepID=UPI00249BB4D5|nr:hypothetical protein [Stenotrophomonas sp. PS02289]